MSSMKARESFWVGLGRTFVLAVTLCGLLTGLGMSGVTEHIVVAVLLFVPIAASLLPYFARRWETWGSDFCFICPLVAYIALSKDKHWGWGTILQFALVSGITALCLTVVTGAITKRRKEIA